MSSPRCLDRTELRLFDPKAVRLTRDAFGRLQLAVGIEERYEPVRAARILPLTAPDSFISLQDEEGEEIGVIEDLDPLDRDSRRILQEELDLVYLKPQVEAILKVDVRQGLISWSLKTSLGPRTVYVRDRSDIRPLPDGRIVLTDVHGARYEIPPIETLDDRSRSWLEVEM
jgi:hypothetical protein